MNWKTITEFPDYLVSTTGQIKSKQRYAKGKGNSKRLLKEKIISTVVTKDGYEDCLLTKDGKRYHRFVHRLVAETFLPNPDDKPQVNHKDKCKLNNHVDNLEWATQSENMIHREQVPSIKTISKIVELHKQGLSIKEIQSQF